jgi:hypothetical protein
MTTKTTIPKCLAVKDRVQRELMREYEARKSEFASYVEFVKATVDDDPNVRAYRQKLTRSGNRAKRPRKVEDQSR